MITHMFAGHVYKDVLNAARQLAQQSGGLIVSVEALDMFTCADIDSGNEVNTGDNGITYVARVNI